VRIAVIAARIPCSTARPHALVRSRPRRSTDSPRRRWPLSPEHPCAWPHVGSKLVSSRPPAQAVCQSGSGASLVYVTEAYLRVAVGGVGLSTRLSVAAPIQRQHQPDTSACVARQASKTLPSDARRKHQRASRGIESRLNTGILRVEPAGIEPATSCLQSRGGCAGGNGYGGFASVKVALLLVRVTSVVPKAVPG
jgi:hypothetical protein